MMAHTAIEHAFVRHESDTRVGSSMPITTYPGGEAKILLNFERSQRDGELRFEFTWITPPNEQGKRLYTVLPAQDVHLVPDDQTRLFGELLLSEPLQTETILGEDFPGEYSDYDIDDEDDEDLDDEDYDDEDYEDEGFENKYWNSRPYSASSMGARGRQSPQHRGGAGGSRRPRFGTLRNRLIDVVLPQMCAHQLCLAHDPRVGGIGETLFWDAGEPWQAVVTLERMPIVQTPSPRASADEPRLHMTGYLVRGEERIDFPRISLLLHNGFFATPKRCGRVVVDDALHWLVELLSNESLTLAPHEVGAFLAKFYESPYAPNIDKLEDIDWRKVQSPPIPQVQIRPDSVAGMQHAWRLTPHFVYGSETIPAKWEPKVVVSSDDRTIYQRDFKAEQVRFRELQQLEHVRLRYVYDVGKSGEQAFVPDKKLDAVLDRLVQAGWQVMLENQKLRQGGKLQLSVKSSVDWFELEGTLDFDGASVGLPSLLNAMRDGKQLIRLDDGTCAMIPKSLRERFARLASLANTEESSVRFQPSQAMLLDALLASEAPDRVRLDQHFEQTREKLRGFEGVKPLEAPTGFQGELRGYQQEGLGWLEFLREFQLGGCLADDMGLGKTIQILAMLLGRKLRPEGKRKPLPPSLIVVPKSLVFNWLDEAGKFTPQLRMLNYTGLERHGLREKLADCDVVITTYGTLRQDIQELKDITFDYVILDEAQAIKNSNSQAAKSCRLLKAAHRLALTGTPVENHLGELWSIFEFLNPGFLGQSTKFQSLVRATSKGPVVSPTDGPSSSSATMNGEENRTVDGKVNRVTVSSLAATQPDVEESATDDGDDARAVRRMLSQALRPFILRRTKSQVLTELPERTETTLFCEMEKRQRDLYDELRDFYRRSLKSKVASSGMAKSKIHVLEALLRLRQAACHPGLVDARKFNIPSAKLDALFEQLEDLLSENHKALIFSQFTSLLTFVRAELDKRGIAYEYLDGQTTDRQRRVDRFQKDPSLQLFLISLRAGGQGLNLTAADYVFILDPWWNPAVEAQAIDRAYRMGQQRNVFAYRLICRGTVEEKILELQRSKRELADAIINEDNSVIRNLTPEDLDMLLS